ncbi:MAG: hypothetical protein ACRC7O_05755 [Fimbriiglobus sp.]
MGATRILLGAVLVGLTGGVAFGQPAGLPTYPPGPAVAGPTLLSSGNGTGTVAPTTAPSPDPTAVLTGVPSGPAALPPGSVAAPWSGRSSAGCCGPVGGNGPMPYEIYFYTGPSLVVGGGSDLVAGMRTGWMVGGGGRTLFLNTAADAAWIVDLGLSYTYNGADTRNRVLDVFTPPPPDAQGNVVDPEQLNTFYLRGLHRTSFNFAFGRDWFVDGPANLGRGTVGGPNWRFGPEIGGRWGSAHVDLLPVANQSGYLRRDGLYHGIFVGAHVDCEIPVGGYVLFSGLKTQWGYDWTNLVPPENGDIQTVNLLWTIGLRF